MNLINIIWVFYMIWIDIIDIMKILNSLYDKFILDNFFILYLFFDDI